MPRDCFLIGAQTQTAKLKLGLGVLYPYVPYQYECSYLVRVPGYQYLTT